MKEFTVRLEKTRASGVVKFPIDIDGWEDTREGGMVVKLVVVDKNQGKNRLAKCSWAYVRDMLSDSFIGDDKRPKPEKGTPQTAEELEEETRAETEWISYHFPMLNAENDGHGIDFTQRFMSRPYLAAMVLGSTNWSGWNSERKSIGAAGKKTSASKAKTYTVLLSRHTLDVSCIC